VFGRGVEGAHGGECGHDSCPSLVAVHVLAIHAPTLVRAVRGRLNRTRGA
jgi:hypothetical protein